MLRISCLALAMVSAAPASATIMQAVYTGTVSSSNDLTGLFGIVGSLDGQAFSLTYIYDTMIGTRTTTVDSDEVYGINVGGPVTYSALTINGVTQNVPTSASAYGSYSAWVKTENSGYHGSANPSTIYHAAVWYDAFSASPTVQSVIQFTAGAYDPSPSFPQGVTTPLALTNLAYPYGYGFGFVTQDLATRAYIVNTSGALAPDTLTVRQLGTPAPVPLPAALPLLAGALTGLAALVRRRRSRPI